jgi:fucose 4-O-acetylase-like acetyltransferase
MPLFFLVAGAASMFALRRRSNRQYISERVHRLLIPFIVVAYFVVQWDVSILVKILVIGISSLLIGLALIELFVKPFGPMRRIFGMKPKKGKEEETKTAVA